MDTTPDAITADVARKYQDYVNPTALNLLRLAGFDRVEHAGSGSIISDIDGNDYIDCLGGYGVFSLGHANEEVVEAVYAQLRQLPLSSKTFLNKPLADLAEQLAHLTPGDLQYSFFCNSGAEAVEGALKFARMATGRPAFISTHGSYHGKTLGALSASGRDKYKDPFRPLLETFSFVPFGDIDALAATINDSVAAVILEPIQGENGIFVAPDGYLEAVRKLCDQHGALLILDEVQTGLGRTGRLFACEHSGVTPDILTLAKALGGGVMPIGAIVGTKAVWDKVFTVNPYLHTSTFGGNQAACTAALKTLEIIQRDGLVARADTAGQRLIAGLSTVKSEFPAILVDVRGRGLMIGVEFADADVGKLVIGSLVKGGVVAAYTLNNPEVMRFEPPLIITDEQIDQVVTVFREAVLEVQQMLEEFGVA
ncbi:MAG: aspartate aminotransferase family protein [Armatimonadota bacterium]